MDEKAAVAALGALAQASRLAVFRHLIQEGPDGSQPGDMVALLGIPGATLSFHLRTLTHAGLVEATPEGRNLRYRARFDAMSDLMAFLTANCCGGDPSRCAPAETSGSTPRRR